MTEETTNEEVVLQEPESEEDADRRQPSVREEAPAGEELKVSPNEEDAVAPAAEEKEEESPIKVGYEVGVRENGDFVFRVKGSSPGVVEMLGVHEYASRKVSLIYDRTQMEGEFAVAAQFNQVNQKFNKTLETLNDLLNQLAAEGQPVPNPSNKKSGPGSPNNNLK